MIRLTKPLVLLVLSVNGFASQAALAWHWNSLPADTSIANNIASAMNQAVAMFNTYSDYNYDIGVAYSSGVPTAQSDYHGQITFGGSIGYGVAMHEMSHWLGTGTTGNWATYAGGTWGGGYANNAEEAYDGPAATLGCDSAHYWPYGWNYSSEYSFPDRHIGLVGAFARDQGLDEDRTIGFAPGTYSLRNRASLRLLDNFGSSTDGAQVRQAVYSGSVNQQWVLTMIPGTTWFRLRSVATGKFLDSLGNSAEGAPVGQALENFSASQQWQVVKTDAGYYKLINVASGKCLDTGGQTSDATGLQGRSSNASANQQWKFVNVTPPAIAAGLLSQYRPVTASSAQAGYFPECANDGKTSVTRWTASGGAYPQWWRVDLGSPCNLTNAIISWFPGAAFQYRIETSLDDVNFATLVDAAANTVQSTTSDNFSAAARYVRVTVTGVTPAGGWAAFYECQLFGTPQISAAPTSLTATAVSSSQINLTWGDQANVTSYSVKRATNDGGPYATIATGVKGVSYSDAGLASSTTYYYVLSGINGGGESAPSVSASATTAAPSLPATPTGLTALPGHNQVLLSWAAAGEAASYLVKRATSSGGPYNIIANPTAATYTDASVINGLNYYYVVSATNTVGESANSAPVTAAPAAMLAHWKFNETSGTTAVDSIAAKNGTLTGGALFMGGKFSNSVAFNGTSSYVSLPAGLVSSLSGNFTLAAWVYVNANGSWARVFDFGTGTTAYMFLAPVSGGNTLRYAITTSGGSGEQQINGPILSAGAWHHVAVAVSGSTGILFVDGVGVGTNTSLTLKPSSLGSTTLNYLGKSQFADPYFNGRIDDFRIYNIALNTAQLVAQANPEGGPPAPTGFVASPGHNQVDLSWTPVSGAGSYRVKRSPQSGGPYSVVGNPAAANYLDATALNGTNYYYVVTAVNGAGESSNSPQFALTPTALFGHWKFNETNGLIAADSAGINPGTVVGGSWAAGKINNAVSLVGAGSSYVSLPAGVVSPLTNFTVATWVYVNANRSWARVFDFGTGATSYMFLAPVSGGNTVRYAITTGSGEQQLNGPPLSAAAWHHVAVTLAGTTGKLYVDGVAVNTNAAMSLKPASLGVTTQNYVGRSQFSDPLLNGLVDDFRIYNRALTNTEISALFSPSGVVPAAPTNVAAMPGDGKVSLNWSPVGGANSYKVKRAPTNGGPYTTLTNSLVSTFTDTSVSNGTLYYYVVAAVNLNGDSVNSSPASATPTSMAPVILAVSLGDVLQLNWPADHTGWRLLVQTNHFEGGLSLNWNDWMTVPGSPLTNVMSLPLDAALPLQFYRLVYP
jgi:fibronectin type 3 domain-containing protein